MQRVNLTKHIFLTAKVTSNSHPEGINMYREMHQCILDNWSLDMYVGYLSQYFIYESILEIVEPIWNKCILLDEYINITNHISTLKVGSQDWLIAISHQSNIAKDLVALTDKTI